MQIISKHLLIFKINLVVKLVFLKKSQISKIFLVRHSMLELIFKEMEVSLTNYLKKMISIKLGELFAK